MSTFQSAALHTTSADDFTRPLETVLSVLLDSFEFAPTKEIHWQFRGLVSPTIDGMDGKDIMPLLVSRAPH